MSCPGSCTTQKGTRISAVMRKKKNKGSNNMKIKVFLLKQYKQVLVVKHSVKNKKIKIKQKR